MSRNVLLCCGDDPERVGLALLARLTPRGDAVPAKNHADSLRVLLFQGSNIEP